MRDQIVRTVGALFIRPDGKVLLGLRAPAKKVWPRHWDTIGGRVEEGESLEEALSREVQEEVGVTPTQFRLIATVKERQPEMYWRCTASCLCCYELGGRRAGQGLR